MINRSMFTAQLIGRYPLNKILSKQAIVPLIFVVCLLTEVHAY